MMSSWFSCRSARKKTKWGHLPIDIIATMTGPQAVSRMFPTA